MNIGNDYSAVSQNYGNNASNAVKQIKQRAAATHSQGDTVTISEAYRSDRNIVGSLPTTHEGLRYPNKKDARFTFGALSFSNRAW